jgi:alkylhydroperoxidase family enzyme
MIYRDSAIAKAVGEDPQSADIPELHKAVFRWMEVFVKNSWQASSDSIAELKVLGATDRDLADWLQIASTQVWFTSSADAGGIPMEANQVTGPVMKRERSFYHGQQLREEPVEFSQTSGASPPKANGWLAAPCEGAAYEAAVSDAESRYGLAPNLFAALSACPDFYPCHQLALDLLEGPQSTTLSGSLHALVRAATVAHNRCDYFVPTAKALLELRGESGVTYEDLLPDPRAIARNDRELAVLTFVAKLISNPYKITAKDAQSFRDTGLDDAAYIDVYNTVAIQTALDRMANCVGVVADSKPLLSGM